MRSGARLLLGDALVRASLVLYVAGAAVVVFSAADPAGWSAGRSEYIDSLLLAMIVVVLFVTRRPISGQRERRFWALLGLAWTCWLLVDLFFFFEAPLPFVSASFAADALFVLFYLFLALAVEVKPHLKAVPALALVRRRFESAAGLFAVFGLIIYFALVDLPEPLGLSLSFVPRAQGLAPYLLVRLSLDLILAGRLLYSALSSAGRWPWLYGLLTAAMIGYAARDGGLLLQTQKPFSASWFGFGWSLFLLLPGILVILAGRYRSLQHGDSATDTDTEGRAEEVIRTSPLALYMLVVPAMHFVLYPFGLLEESSRGAREVFCLLYLIAVGMMAAIHQRLTEMDRRQAIQALRKEVGARRQINRELEHRQAELEQFTYTISHELKAPLVTIHGFLGLAERGIDESRHEHLERDLSRIHDAANDMSRLLTELLELSKVGWVVDKREWTSMSAIAGAAAGRLALEVRDGRPNIEIESKMPRVWVDAARIEDVLVNLITNAVKFTPPNRVPEIRVGCRRGDSPVFFVSDNGRGIEPRYHEKVFGLFDRLHQGIEGNGVGLALVRRIIEKHNGKVWVESDGRDNGSTFCFTVREKPEGTETNEIVVSDLVG